MTVSPASGDIDVRIIRSPRRRTMQLRVGVKGVELRAPTWTALGEINTFISRHRHWIEQALREGGHVAGSSQDVFSSGGTLYVMGEPCSLEILPPESSGPSLEELPSGWRVKADAVAARKLVEKWFRIKARVLLTALVLEHSRLMQVDLPVVVIKDQQRLWGSYSARTHSVNLNWRLIAFPPDIIDYVIIHELCHARHLHHGPEFWDEVFRFCPGWRERRLWLRTKARKYTFI